MTDTAEVTKAELLTAFVEQNFEGAAGCEMDCDTAQALAVAIHDLQCRSEKYREQVIDTCKRAESAEAKLSTAPRADALEQASAAVFRHLYGQDANPFERPESYEHSEAIARAALTATPPPPAGEGDVLPCDVRLPPATVIKAGCSFNTLRLAMTLEGRPRHFDEPVSELDRQKAASCPCIAAERHLPDCPKHGEDPNVIHVPPLPPGQYSVEDGKVVVPDDALLVEAISGELFRSCPKCQGHGSGGHGDSIKCYFCHGNGIIKLTPEQMYALRSMQSRVEALPMTSAEFHQRRGMMGDAVIAARGHYRSYMADDNYNAQGALDKMFELLETAETIARAAVEGRKS